VAPRALAYHQPALLNLRASLECCLGGGGGGAAAAGRPRRERLQRALRLLERAQGHCVGARRRAPCPPSRCAQVMIGSPCLGSCVHSGSMGAAESVRRGGAAQVWLNAAGVLGKLERHAEALQTARRAARYACAAQSAG
jgi:hypothetical protein